MSILNNLMVRRRAMPRFSAKPQSIRRRLALACLELTEAEGEMAEKLGLSRPPRLLMVDEEEAVVVSASDRNQIS